MNTSKPDIAMAGRFLARLDARGAFTFQTFSDRREKGVRRSDFNAKSFHGPLEQHAQVLAQLNARGAGVFVMVNEGDGVKRASQTTCRSTDNIVRLRAHVLDLDGAPLDPVLATGIAPHIIVESSPGKWHVYWLLEANIVNDDNRNEVAAQYKARQLAIAEKFSGDKNVCDLPRVLRVPGFFHQKAAPFMTRLVKNGDSS